MRRKARKRLRFWPPAWGLLAVLGTLGCGPPLSAPKTAEQYQAEARGAYDEAVQAYLDQDWETAVRLFGKLRRDFSYTRYARLAELRLADIAFRQEKFAEATAQYKSFARDYPSDPEVPYARFRVVRGQFLQSGDSIFQPPLEERDLGAVRSAYQSLHSFIADYPDYHRHVELSYMLEVVTGVLARHELYVARFYLKHDEYVPAIERVRYALTRYRGSGLDAEAVALMGETYLKMKDRAKAEAAFRQLLSEYPASPFAVPAREFLEFLGTGANAGD
jgi:outer membrane protein assembly factor BamD